MGAVKKYMVMAFCGFFLSGCASVMDVTSSAVDSTLEYASFVNPMNWFGDDDGPQKAEKKLPQPPVSNNDYASLGTVPARQEVANSQVSNGQQQSLHADNKIAKAQNQLLNQPQNPYSAPQAFRDKLENERNLAKEPALIAQIYFEQASSVLTDNDKKILQQVVQLVQSMNPEQVYVSGHATANREVAEAPNENALRKLSQDRAVTVARQLNAYGVNSEILSIIAEGGSKPRYDDSSVRGAAGNRRAEIVFVNYKKF